MVAPKLQRENTKYVKQRVLNRDSPPHEDFMTPLLKDSPSPDVEFLVAQTMNLVIGNAEATSNVFTAGVHLLGANPDKMAKLKDVIRGRFASYDEIDYDTVQNIPWLNAVVNEGLRFATQGTSGLPRISPGAFVDGHYIPRGVNISPRPLVLCN